MKRMALFFLVLLALSACEKNDAANPDIADIPDTAFLFALIDYGVDSDGDSLICYGNQVNEIVDLSQNRSCVWTDIFPPSNVNADTGGSPNVFFTTDYIKQGSCIRFQSPIFSGYF